MKRYSFLGLFFCFIASTDLVYANSNFIGFLSVEEVHSLHQFLWIVTLLLILVTIFPLRFTSIPFRSIWFFVTGLLMLVMSGVDGDDLILGASFIHIFIMCGFIIAVMLITNSNNLSQIITLRDSFSAITIPVCSALALVLMSRAEKVSGYVSPSFMIGFTILSLILFMVEFIVSQRNNKLNK
ncbi:MAG: hypothetical protein UZ19_OD1000653 [Parcubacteria bacterium OLB19]|nr:MAG: hypothetical protein UZ19_OD1000653 [Parcubacteria bacterium OLB19]